MTPKGIKKFIATLGTLDIIGGAQTSVLIGTGKILKNPLSQ